MKRGGLGKGLDALLPQSEELLQTVVQDIAIEDIDPNQDQPRKDFDKEALEQLAESIRSEGVLSPILVVQNGLRYSIVAGERRYRAARMAGLATVPCIVRDLTGEQQLTIALIENIQREDLNPIEEANAINGLIQSCGLTQEQAAQKLGKSRPAVANSLRLLKLPQEVVSMVASGELSAGHARVLAGLEDENRQKYLAIAAVQNEWSVRKLEEMAGEVKKTAASSAKKKTTVSPELTALCNHTREALGLKVSLSGTEKKGKIILSYSNAEELELFCEKIANMLME